MMWSIQHLQVIELRAMSVITDVSVVNDVEHSPLTSHDY
jgi:hypothetical protein